MPQTGSAVGGVVEASTVGTVVPPNSPALTENSVRPPADEIEGSQAASLPTGSEIPHPEDTIRSEAKEGDTVTAGIETALGSAREDSVELTGLEVGGAGPSPDESERASIDLQQEVVVSTEVTDVCVVTAEVAGSKRSFEEVDADLDNQEGASTEPKRRKGREGSVELAIELETTGEWVHTGDDETEREESLYM